VQFCVFVRSWCIGGIAIFPGGNFSDREFYSDFVFSATLQDFCCRITETSNFFSAVCHIPVYISFVCVQYHRLNACVQSLRQRNYIQLQKNTIITPPQRHHIYPLVAAFCFVCQLSRTYPRLFLARGHSYIFYLKKTEDSVVIMCVIT